MASVVSLILRWAANSDRFLIHIGDKLDLIAVFEGYNFEDLRWDTDNERVSTFADPTPRICDAVLSIKLNPFGHGYGSILYGHESYPSKTIYHGYKYLGPLSDSRNG